MKNVNSENEKDLIFHTLHQNWEGAVSMGLQRLSDDELLGLLTEVGKHADDCDEVLDEAFVDVPDWDDKTPAELEAIACAYGVQTGGTSSGATSVRAPLRRRHNPSPAQLSFEELESRFSPSTFSVIAHGRAGFAPVCTTRWALAAEQTSAAPYHAPAAAWSSASATDHADHILFDFDAEALSHMALAQVA